MDPETLGLPGAAQLLRIETHTQHLRKGQVYKESREVSFVITSLWESEITPQEILAAARAHWSIENRQHYRRDRTQNEDRCGTRLTRTAQNLSLLRSLAIFLFEHQRARPKAARSLPEFEKRNDRRPRTLIDRFMKTRG